MVSYHKRDVDSPDEVNGGVTSWLLGHKHKSFGVQGVKFSAILQESYVFPWPVFPGCKRENRGYIGQLVQMSFVLISHNTNTMIPDGPDARWLLLNRT